MICCGDFVRLNVVVILLSSWVWLDVLVSCWFSVLCVLVRVWVIRFFFLLCLGIVMLIFWFVCLFKVLVRSFCLDNL